MLRALGYVVLVALLVACSTNAQQASKSSGAPSSSPEISHSADDKPAADIFKDQSFSGDPYDALESLREQLTADLAPGSPEASLTDLRLSPFNGRFFTSQSAAFDAAVNAAGSDVLRGDHIQPTMSLFSYGDKEVVVDYPVHEQQSSGDHSLTTDGSIKIHAENGTLFAHSDVTGSVNTNATGFAGTNSGSMNSDGQLGICPDPAGIVDGHLTIRITQKWVFTQPGPARTYEMDLRGQADLRGHNGDDSNLIKWDLLNLTFQGTAQNFQTSETKGFTWQGSETGIQPGVGFNTGSINGWIRTKDVNLAGAMNLALLAFAHLLGGAMIQTAEKAWQNGYCVKLVLQANTKQPLTPGGFGPVHVEVHHRKDNSTLNVPISGDAGDSGSVMPEKATSTSTLTLVAGGTPPSGVYQMSIETTSKRGKDRAGVTWGDLGSFDITASITEACDVGGDGWTVTGHIDPVDSDPGTLAGTGTYSGNLLVADPDVHTISIHGSAKIWGTVVSGKLIFLAAIPDALLRPVGGSVPVKGGRSTGHEHGDWLAMPSYTKDGKRIMCDRTYDAAATRTK